MEIGGYFGFELPKYENLYSDVIYFQSARATIRAVLECSGFEYVLMPAYICNSIIEAGKDAGLKVHTYELDEKLFPKVDFNQNFDKTGFLYVNYFGIYQNNTERLKRILPKDHLIIDNSHALFAPHIGELATIYSPRKFVGLPDGGLLRASDNLNIQEPKEEDLGSLKRMNYLMTRLAYSAREGYEGFNDARLSLADSYPLKMSRLTRRLMCSIPWQKTADKRRENSLAMAYKLNELNDFKWKLNDTDVPLCYPLMLNNCDVKSIKNDLSNLDIFTATYWLDAVPRIKPNSIEDMLINRTVFLPIDQRLNLSDINFICDTVLNLISKYKC
jgi:hypothetical protein